MNIYYVTVSYFDKTMVTCLVNSLEPTMSNLKEFLDKCLISAANEIQRDVNSQNSRVISWQRIKK